MFRNEYKTIKKSGLFDEKYYLEIYEDIRKADVNPIKHYIKHGWKEGRNPSDTFDTNFYLDNYSDVKYSKMNPLIHFIRFGQKEGRKTMIKKVINEIKKNGIKSAFDKSVNKIQEKLDSITNDEKKISQGIPRIIFDETKDEFIEYVNNSVLNTKVKLIAFYLPQFHPFPENDKWWGKGFTEWTNVTKAKPNFVGHYQPHLPIHNGFYDLRIPEIMIEQAKLARNYGIYGFNFYYYWFDGKILMQRPFEILLEHKEIDINFCITWANENWTRRWDGAEHDILMGQNHCTEDSTKFIESLYKYFEDERYIRIDNKPVLIIYRVDIIPNMKETVNLWRKKVKEAGFDGLYLICSQTFGIKSPEPYGFDAAMEFPPHTVKSQNINNKLEFYNNKFEGVVYDYEQVVKNAIKNYNDDEFKLFRTAMLSWDNTARKQNNSHTFYNFSLLKYKQWISNIVTKMYNDSKYKDEEKLIFINAWNEWAEGTHLEPDRKFGYGYLQSTYEVLKNFPIKYNSLLKFRNKKEKNIAVILHIHYTDVWEDINKYLSNLNEFGFDLYVTVTNVDNNIIENILHSYKNANIVIVENRGRDILPFINIYNKIKHLDYKYVCKIHSKKSLYRNDGNIIRDELYQSLLGNKQIVSKILDLFEEDLNLGIVSNNKYLIEHTAHNMTYDTEIVNDLCKVLKIKFEYSKFPAGSMFWFRLEALKGIDKIEEKDFEIEEGLADGTLAHGVERLFCNLSQSNSFTVKGI
ncbi:glycoside hydrolase family 99-like domain-containing protein [Aliarcobacter butzleri]|uniref:glycoside hydrolase family 99-like domain-containing protein n=1 Tax=Aliarcobacter butzleri TaxID=28197 RepID=UPI0021B6CC08|nr:glycoside hydrolase family 99-like domain-containing protein [Aliarcobacter butzleri]MCT7580162.1 glycoside hydrolase family 99-like domain-containing protein [Aliarcobacter butzleri]